MNKPSIIRAEHKTKYTVVTNALAQDQNLTYAARGMILTLLSYPDDWTIRPGNLRQKGCGYNKVYKLLNELIEAGYLKREETRDEKKQRRTAYIALEIPIKPCDEIHNEEKPRDENHHDGIHDDGIHHVLQSNEGKPSNQEKQSNESLTPSASDTSIPSLPKPAKPAPKPAKSVSRKELPTDVFFNALADDFYGGMRKGNSMVGRALFGKKEGYLGIIAHEMERQHKTREQLDYNALALMSPKFKAWFNQQHDKPLTLRDPEKLIGWWETWRNTTNHVNCPPVIFYNPDCPHKADPEPCEEGWILTTKPDGERVRIPCECQMKIRKEKGLPW